MQTFYVVKNLVQTFYGMVDKWTKFMAQKCIPPLSFSPWSKVKTDMYMYMLKGIPTHHISISDLKPAKNAGKLVFSGVDSALNVKCLLKRGEKDITHKIKSTY